MKRFFLRLSLIGLMVIAVSMALEGYYRYQHELEYPLPKNIWPVAALSEPYQIVKLGNSHPHDGISFDKYNLKSLDLTGSGQELQYDLALLKQQHAQIAEGAVILIAVTPITFSQRPSAIEDGLQRFYYGRISPLYIPNLQMGDYLQQQFFPFFRTGIELRQKHRDKVEKRIEGEQAGGETKAVVEMMPDLELKPQQKVLALLASSERIIVEDGYFNVEFITAELESPSTGDNERLEESMHFMFGKWYNTDEFSLDYAEANRRLLESIIEYCLRQEWQPVLVTIPISQVLEDGLAEDYKQVYLYDQVAKTDLKGAKYYDFSSKPTPKSNSDFFSNSDHLNADGAALFSYLLLRQLINEKMLPESADGYTYPKTSSSGETVDYLQIVDQYLP